MSRSWVGVALTAVASQVFPAEQTVVLSLPTMNCAVCPITVKRALSRVPGVNRVVVVFDKRTATVTYDDAATREVLLIAATANAGYPSTVAARMR